MQFGTYFVPVWAPMLEPLDLLKQGFRTRRPTCVVLSPLSTRTPFWTLPGSLGGTFWPPRWLQPVLRFLLERPRAAQRIFFSAPRGEKEGSKKGAKKGTRQRRLRRPKMECPAECAGPVLAHLSLFRPEYAKRPGSTPSTTRGGRRIAHAHSAGPGILDRGPLAKRRSETWPGTLFRGQLG